VVKDVAVARPEARDIANKRADLCLEFRRDHGGGVAPDTPITGPS
jgi:hypothetical protein